MNVMRTHAHVVMFLIVTFESFAFADDTPVQAEVDHSKVLVVVEGDEKVVIEEHKDWLEGVWAPQCYGSCWLPIGSTVRITRGSMASRRFRMASACFSGALAHG